VSAKKFLLACLLACNIPSTSSRSNSTNFGHLVERHVSELFRQGYARNMNDSDFNHGHAILAQRTSHNYKSLDEFVLGIRMMLYHTDELPDGHEPSAHRKRPRSIAGLPDGRIVPAAGLVDMQKLAYPEYYKYHGTILPQDIIGTHPKLFYSADKSKIPTLAFAGRLTCEIDLVAEPSGCFFSAGHVFNIYAAYDRLDGAGLRYKKLGCK